MSKLSAEAFLHQIESGKRTTDAMRVYKHINDVIRVTPPTYKTMMIRLNMTHGTITARLSELCDMGVIFEDHNGYFHITPPDKIAQYAAMREDARYKKWRKLGDKNGWFNQLKLV